MKRVPKRKREVGAGGGGSRGSKKTQESSRGGGGGGRIKPEYEISQQRCADLMITAFYAKHLLESLKDNMAKRNGEAKFRSRFITYGPLDGKWGIIYLTYADRNSNPLHSKYTSALKKFFLQIRVIKLPDEMRKDILSVNDRVLAESISLKNDEGEIIDYGVPTILSSTRNNKAPKNIFFEDAEKLNVEDVKTLLGAAQCNAKALPLPYGWDNSKMFNTDVVVTKAPDDNYYTFYKNRKVFDPDTIKRKGNVEVPDDWAERIRAGWGKLKKYRRERAVQLKF